MKKRCLIRELWAQVEPYWHIATAIFMALVTAVWWVGDVNSQAAEIARHDQQLLRASDRIDNLELMRSDVAATKQRVDDIALFIGVPRRGAK